MRAGGLFSRSDLSHIARLLFPLYLRTPLLSIACREKPSATQGSQSQFNMMEDRRSSHSFFVFTLKHWRGGKQIIAMDLSEIYSGAKENNIM